MEKNDYTGPEKRKHPRFEFPPAVRPTFRTAGCKCQVKDISRGGLKFTHLGEKKLEGWIRGTLELAKGHSIDLEGIIVRTENKDMGLAFIVELPEEMLTKILEHITAAGD